MPGVKTCQTNCKGLKLCSAIIFILCLSVIGASKVRLLKASFDACCVTSPLALEYRDPHVFACALKSYLRDLPEPLMTHTLYDEWMAATRWGMP